jgi:hypothetical protein
MNLGFLVLRRKRKFEILEKGQNYDLHLKKTANIVNWRLVTQSVGYLRKLPSDARTSAGC